VAGLARGSSEAILVIIRRALDISRHAGAGINQSFFERPIVITNAAYRFMVL
jgi:hypothetical protein